MSKQLKASSSPKRKLSRDPATGTFEAPSPQNDPAILEQAVRWVRAIEELLPLFGVGGLDLEDEKSAMVIKVSGLCLSTLRQSMLDQLALADDKEFLREAKKPILRAARRSIAKPDVSYCVIKGGDAL
jgi:hypothetical protein